MSKLVNLHLLLVKLLSTSKLVDRSKVWSPLTLMYSMSATKIVTVLMKAVLKQQLVLISNSWCYMKKMMWMKRLCKSRCNMTPWPMPSISNSQSALTLVFCNPGAKHSRFPNNCRLINLARCRPTPAASSDALRSRSYLGTVTRESMIENRTPLFCKENFSFF